MALVKANRKQLKAALASGVKKLDPLFLALKLGVFPLFDGFLDIVNLLLFEFLDLDNFRPFDNFPVFNDDPFFLIDLLSPSTLLILLAASISLVASTCDNIVIFNIDISGATILMKL